MRYFVRHIVRRADQWAHFHRFEYRPLCDLHDVLNGTPRSIVRMSRDRGAPVHSWTKSFHAHPSQREVTHG